MADDEQMPDVGLGCGVWSMGKELAPVLSLMQDSSLAKMPADAREVKVANHLLMACSSMSSRAAQTTTRTQAMSVMLSAYIIVICG